MIVGGEGLGFLSVKLLGGWQGIQLSSEWLSASVNQYVVRLLGGMMQC